MSRWEREQELVKATERQLDRIADPHLDLPVELIERVQAALKRAYDANLIRLLEASNRARAVDAVGETA